MEVNICPFFFFLSVNVYISCTIGKFVNRSIDRLNSLFFVLLVCHNLFVGQAWD